MKSVFFGILALFVHPIFSFCVYNNLDNGGYILVINELLNVSSDRWFRAVLKPGEKQCCHFSNKDCSPWGTDRGAVLLTVTFAFGDNIKRKTYEVHCTAGGGLEFHGSDGNLGGTCSKADGTVQEIEFRNSD